MKGQKMGKRGPKKMAGKREANGQLSRQHEEVAIRSLKKWTDLDAAERDAMLPATSARVRVDGTEPEDIRSTDAGSFVGRLFLRGVLNKMQVQAADTYLEDCRNNSIVWGSPRQPGAVNLNATRGRPAGLSDEFVLSSISRFNAMRAAVILGVGGKSEWRRSSVLFDVLAACVLNDRPAEHLVPILRQALDVLAAHYRLGEEGKQKAA